MSASQECAILAVAASRSTLAPAVRRRLAILLNQLDRFDEAIALLEQVSPGDRSDDEILLLADALLAVGDAQQAAQVARAARGADALVMEAKVLLRSGADAAGRARLRAALGRVGAHVAAFEQLAHVLLRAGELAAVRDLIDTADRAGARHAPWFAARAMVEASEGQPCGSRDWLGLDRFCDETMLAGPEGFDAALAAELLANPSIRDRRHGIASVATRRIDSLVAGGGPLAKALVDRLVDAVRRRCAELVESDHPWVRAMPSQATLRSWCVITGGDGHERWHMHPHGWMSGVYYVAVPGSAGGDCDAGCLSLGLSDHFVSEEAAQAVGERQVRPRPGLLATFPSHVFHRTRPHGSSDTRIAVAFDVAPC